MAPICSASVVDLSAPKNLATNIGVLQGFSIGFAFLFGAPIGGIIASRSSPVKAFKLAAVVSGLNFLWNAFFIKESFPESARSTSRQTALQRLRENANPLQNFSFLTDISRRRLTLTLFLVWVALNGFQVTCFNYAKHAFDWEVSKTAIYQAMSGVCLATVPKLVVPVLGAESTVRWGLRCFALSLLVMGMTKNSGVFGASVVMVGVGAAMVIPALTSLISETSSSDKKGRIFGAVESSITLNRAVVYPIVGRLFAKGMEDDKGFFGLIGGTSSPFYLGVVALALAAACFR